MFDFSPNYLEVVVLAQLSLSKMSRSRVTHSGSQRIATTSSVISARKERSFSSRVRKSSENGFAAQFKSFCAELGIEEEVPKVKISYTEPEYGFRDLNSNSKAKISSKVPESCESIQFLIVLKTEGNDEVVDMVIFKQYCIGNELLSALQKTFSTQQNIRVLKLEFCNLDHQQIKAVKYLLLQNSSIEDLSLNGNPNKYQNFYVLLKNTNLQFLSLKFCQINDRGVEKISEFLSDPFPQTLLALNLASNFITDDGVQHIANALRSNRCLVHLNLADNFLTDSGCTRLMEVFQKFPLRHSEIVVRRKRNLANLLKATELIAESKSNSSQKSSSSVVTSKTTTPRKSKSQSRRSSKDKTSVSSGSSVKKKKSKEKKLVKANVVLPQDLHPFVAECYPEDMEIYCRGNLKLSYLNLAYNKISAEGLQAVADVLKYQNEQNEGAGLKVGLTRLILEGNNLSECSLEVEAITDLLCQISNRRGSGQYSKLGSRSASRKLALKKSL